jgi:adenylyl cyclase-associated protein
MRRLEAATSRLEDMVPNMSGPAASTNGVQSAQAQGMPTAEGMGQSRGNAPPPYRHTETLPPTIDDFDSTINDEVKTFVNMSEEIGGLVAEQVCQERRLRYKVRPEYET